MTKMTREKAVHTNENKIAHTMKKKQYTKEQHYVPRFILKYHTFFTVPMKCPRLFQFDKQNGIQRTVIPEEICKEKNLYEFKDANSVISKEERNLIEDCLNKYETKWKSVIQKKINGDILSEKDNAWFYLLVAIQLLRTPEVLKLNRDQIKELDTTLPVYKADRYAKLASLVFGDLKPEVNWILTIVLKMLCNLNLVFYNSTIPFVLNNQRPVLCTKLYKSDKPEMAEYFFPVTKNICIALLKNKPEESDIEIPDKFTLFLNNEMFDNCGRMIYSSAPIKDTI